MPVTPAEDEEFTELVDAHFPRVDLVGKAANGTPFLIAKSAHDGGLLDPVFVRSLISKGQPAGSGSEEPPMTGSPAQDLVTVNWTGSPTGIGQVMASMQGAPVRKQSNLDQDTTALVAKAQADYPGDPVLVAVSKAAYDAVIKEKYNAADRKKMAGKEAMEDGSYPVKDEEDLSNAIHAVGRGGADHDAIRRHVIARAKALGKSSMIPDNWASDGSLKEPVSKADGGGPEVDQGVDGLDPTVPLAQPATDAPGDPTDPGSPAWEAIDAATAAKWTAILGRAKVAIGLLAEREMIEAVAADPGDMDDAWDLQDACCAIDYAISVLAPFAAGEQMEADMAVEAVGKALGGFPAEALDIMTGLSSVIKSATELGGGPRALAFRDTTRSVCKALMALPKAPPTQDGQPAAVAKEATVADDQAGTPAGTTTTTEPAPAPVEKAAEGTPAAAGNPGDGTPAAVPPGGDVAKAQDAMMAVYDAAGKLVGVVAPDQVTPVQGGEAAEPEAREEPPAHEPPAAAAAGHDDTDGSATTEDLTPQPPADAGTPAGKVGKEAAPAEGSDTAAASAGEDVTKTAAGDTAAASDTTTQDPGAVLKSLISEVVREVLGAQGPVEDVAKQADVAGLGETVEALKARLEVFENQPAVPKVVTNGAQPPAHMLRGQNQAPDGTTAPQVGVAKAAELKGQLVNGDAAQRTAAFNEMQSAAVDALAALQKR